MDPYQESNVRMPRACKRGRPPQADGVKSQSRRGRKPKASLPQMTISSPYSMGETSHAHQQILQQQQQQHHQMQQQQQHQQQQQQQQQQEMAASYSRSERIRAAAEIAQRQSARYYTRAQVNQLSPPYIQANQRSMAQSAANQVLYPNISQVPRTTATYTLPEQMSQLTYTSYSRGTTHNLPLTTAPSMERYWQTNTHRPPVMTTTTQQINKPAPVAQSLPPKTPNIDEATQTECTLTDTEMKFLKTLRSKRMDVNDINVIIEKDDYVVYYTEPEKQKDNSRIDADNLNALVQQSERFKATFALMARAFPLGQMPVVNPAIRYLPAQPIIPNGDVLVPGVSPASPEGAQETPNNLKEPTEGGSNGANVAQPQQMAQQPNASNIQYSPIPTIFNHNFGFRRPGQNVHNSRGGHRNQNMNPFFQIPHNFMQNFQYPGMYNYVDNRFEPPPTPLEESEIDNTLRWL